MEEYKKLNAVLHLMSDKKTKMLLTISENLKLDKGESELILEFLLDKGFVQRVYLDPLPIDSASRKWFWKISFSGLMFHKQGGFKPPEKPNWYNRNKDWLLVILGAVVASGISIIGSHLEKDQEPLQIEIEQKGFETIQPTISLDTIKGNDTIPK